MAISLSNLVILPPACQYKNETYDFICDELSIDADSEFCIFHDTNYLKDHNYEKHKEEVTKRFEEKLLEYSSKHMPLKFVGYYLPEISFEDHEFTEPLYFNDATFYGLAYFRGASFSNKADFGGAKFSNKADFYAAKFSKANFTLAAFYNKADFGMATFSNKTNFDGAAFYNKADFYAAKFSNGAYFRAAVFSNEASFLGAIFSNEASFLLANFEGKVDFSEANLTDSADFGRSNFKNGAEFIGSNFPSYVSSEHLTDIPIRFEYSTFEKGARFIGRSKPLELGLVSFKDVDLSNVEFHNVKWIKKREILFFTRMEVIDEQMLHKNHNYGEISTIYSQLRNNYQSRGQFDEASHFIIGEMETKRKALLNEDTTTERLGSISYSLAKWLSLYGQSAVLPLFVWTPLFAIIFTLLRVHFGICSVPHVVTHGCYDPISQFIDSIAAILQSPRASPNLDIDVVERVASLPLIGLGIRNALKTVFGFFGGGT